MYVFKYSGTGTFKLNNGIMEYQIVNLQTIQIVVPGYQKSDLSYIWLI